MEPENDDLYQDEPTSMPMTPIPIVAEGPVRVQLLPARSAGMRTWDLVDGVAVRILDADPRRRRAILQAVGASYRLGSTQATAGITGAGAQFTDGVVLELTTADEVWAAGAGGATVLSVLNEQWAE